MEISLRAQSMPESPIRKLAKYADAAKLAGVHVYHLNIGQPDIQTPPQALEAVKNFRQDILSYSPSQGLKSLRICFEHFGNGFKPILLLHLFRRQKR